MFKMPKLREVFFAFHFVFSNLFSSDPPLSSLGRRQVADLNIQLREKKNSREGDHHDDDLQSSLLADITPDLFIVSPLRRAMDTYLGMVANHPTLASIPYIIRHDLVEPTWGEFLSGKAFTSRVRRFERWLYKDLPSTQKKVVIIGHSLFFQRMIGSKDYCRNVDIWQVNLKSSPLSRISCEWSDMKLLFRSKLSSIHVITRFLHEPNFDCEDEDEESYTEYNGGVETSSKAQEFKAKAKEDDNENDNDDGSVLTCRICQGTSEESPHLPLLRPCLCRGSLALVHVKCLNEWRATSSSAREQCSVCGYTYQTKKEPLSSGILALQWVSSPSRLWILTLSICILLIFLTGFVTSFILDTLFSFFPSLPSSSSSLRPSPHHLQSATSLVYTVFGIQNRRFNCPFLIKPSFLPPILSSFVVKLNSVLCQELGVRLFNAFLAGNLTLSLATLLLSLRTAFLRILRRERVFLDESQTLYIICLFISLATSSYDLRWATSLHTYCTLNFKG